MRRNEVLTMLKHFLKQYEDLVWYAQQDKTDLNHPDRARVEEIRREHPLASFAVSGSAPEWSHGFNCGCLTEARRVLALLDKPGAATNEQAVAVSRWSDQLGTYIGPEEVGVEAPKKGPTVIAQEEWDTLPAATRERIARDYGYRERNWVSGTASGETGGLSCLEKQLKVTLMEACDHYSDLVSYARKDKTDPNHPARTFIERIEEKHPDQVFDLQSEDGDWHHGFNSGCLATVRLAINLLGSPEDAELAIKFFPDLDT